MPVELVNPERLVAPTGYTHVSVATGSKLVHVAGQVALASDGTLTGEDNLRAQTVQALRNLVAALNAVGATFDDVAQFTVYVPKWEPAKREALISGFRAAASELGINPVRPSSLVGVDTLAEPAWLIEISAVAVIP